MLPAGFPEDHQNDFNDTFASSGTLSTKSKLTDLFTATPPDSIEMTASDPSHFSNINSSLNQSSANAANPPDPLQRKQLRFNLSGRKQDSRRRRPKFLSKFSPNDGKIHVNSNARDHESQFWLLGDLSAKMQSSLLLAWDSVSVCCGSFCCSFGIPDTEIGGNHIGLPVRFKSPEERLAEEWQRFSKKSDKSEIDEDTPVAVSLKDVKKLLRRLNVAVPQRDVSTWLAKYAEDSSGKLTFKEFRKMFFSIQSVPDLREEFLRAKLKEVDDEMIIERMGITASPQWQWAKLKYLVPSDLAWFFSWASNGVHAPTEQECADLILKYSPNKDETPKVDPNSEPEENKKPESDADDIDFENLQMNYESFVHMLTDLKANRVADPAKVDVVYQDMTQPMSHYFISSSHNSYLLGNQLNSESSPEALKRILTLGVRVVELDCWDGADGLPIVNHGRTLCKPTTFESCIIAVKEFAFVKTVYPLIVTIENHCCRKQQKAQAAIMTRVLGDQLFIWDELASEINAPKESRKSEEVLRDLGPMDFLSPEDLKGKIIIRDRAKKKPKKKKEKEIDPPPATLGDLNQSAPNSIPAPKLNGHASANGPLLTQTEKQALQKPERHEKGDKYSYLNVKTIAKVYNLSRKMSMSASPTASSTAKLVKANVGRKRLPSRSKSTEVRDSIPTLPEEPVRSMGVIKEEPIIDVSQDSVNSAPSTMSPSASGAVGKLKNSSTLLDLFSSSSISNGSTEGKKHNRGLLSRGAAKLNQAAHISAKRPRTTSAGSSSSDSFKSVKSVAVKNVHRDLLLLLYIKNLSLTLKNSSLADLAETANPANSSATSAPVTEPDKLKKKKAKKITYMEPDFASSASIQEAVMKKLATPGHNSASLNTYCKVHLVRVYPAATRINSSNYDPVGAWNAGCQIVALNYQYLKMKVWLNEGKFMMNGGCGYVLKPHDMLNARNTGVVPSAVRSKSAKLILEKDAPEGSIRWTLDVNNFTPTVLCVRVVSGHYLPKKSGDLKYRHPERTGLINPYVELKLKGLKSQSKKTRWVESNGFNPRWNEAFEFEVHHKELSLLAFVVKSKDKSNDGAFVAQRVLPVDAIRPGFRVVTLLYKNGAQIDSAHLLCRFTWK